MQTKWDKCSHDEYCVGYREARKAWYGGINYDADDLASKLVYYTTKVKQWDTTTELPIVALEHLIDLECLLSYTASQPNGAD